jgi:hypothetical protein
MPHILDPDVVRVVVDRVEHAAITDPYTPDARHTDNELHSSGPRIIG